MGTLLGLGSKRSMGTHHHAHLLTPSSPLITKNIPKPTFPQLVLHLRIPISRNNLLRRQLHPRWYAFLCVIVITHELTSVQTNKKEIHHNRCISFFIYINLHYNTTFCTLPPIAIIYTPRGNCNWESRPK